MMATQLEATLLTVGDLFGEARTRYEIPIYQRNFAWGIEEIEQLVDDVWSAARTDAESYFLGNLIVSARAAAEGLPVTFEVIDGQQRLTTLLMLLRHLNQETAAQLNYQARRTATAALARLAPADDEGSGIHLGYKTIGSRMEKFTHEDRVRFRDFLLSRVQVVRAVLPAHTDLNRYFEIMNTRGQQLEQVDIVKARLMSYLRGNGVEAQRAGFAWLWDACADMNSYIQLALTPRDTEARKRIFGERWDRLHLTRFADLVPLRLNADDSNATRSTGISVRDAIRLYAQTTEEPARVDSNKQSFESPIKFPSLLLHTLRICHHLAADEVDGDLDDNRLIKLFDNAFKRITDNERAEKATQFIETLLRCKFVLDNYVLKREFTATNGEVGAWSLKRLTRGPRNRVRFLNTFSPEQQEQDYIADDDPTGDVLLLQSMLRVTYTSPRTMHWITLILRQRFRELTAESLSDSLQKYARSKVRHAFFGRNQPTGFEIERIVFTYLDYLLAIGADPAFTPRQPFTFAFRNSVEHFFPQHANRDDHGWDAVGEHDPELQMLGNLALVSVSANSKFSNSLPSHKADKREIVRQSTKLQLMAGQVNGGVTWNKHAILAHNKSMVELLTRDMTGTIASSSIAETVQLKSSAKAAGTLSRNASTNDP